MKTFLLVMGDQAAREELARGVASMTDEIRVLQAAHGEEAARALAGSPIDILATELVMPVMDGFELLSHVLDQYPATEVIVMGETDLGRTSQALCAGGAFRFLSKPVVVADLVDVVRNVLARPASGRLSGLSLAGFLQLLSAEGRTCCLRVRARGHEARLDLYDGELINASTGTTEGKEAFFLALGWGEPEIEVEDANRSAARLIQDRLPSLLLEAALRDDGAVLEVGEGSPPEAGRDSKPAPRGGRPVGSFTSFTASPLPPEVAAEVEELRGFMDFEGALGAGIVDLETGRSLAHVCRGREAYFARLAAEAADAVRAGMRDIGDLHLRQAMRQFKLHGPKHFQLMRLVRGRPDLLLVFSGFVGRVDPSAAGARLAALEERLVAAALRC